MRSFPRTRFRPVPARPGRLRVLLVCAVLVATTVTAALPEAAARDLREKQRQLRGQMKHAQGDLNESSQALSAAARRLGRARTQLAAAQRRLNAAQRRVDAAVRRDRQAQAQLEAAERRLAAARVELDKARRRVVAQRAAIGELAASNYANGDPALLGLAVILNSQDPEEVTSQMNTVDALMSRQTRLLEDLRVARAQMVAEEAQVRQARAAVASRRVVARANLVRTQGLERAAAEVRSEVAVLVSRGRSAERQAASARRADMAELRALKTQEERVKRLILERARRQSGGFKGSAGGLLSRPVPGAVTSPYGYRRHPIYGYYGLHDGTDFSAPCGTSNRAVASGTVISRYFSSVYGNRLYLDLGRVNGRNMTVIYNHLSSYAASTGERVERGEVIGYSGSTGWSTGCHLHFTVLLNGRAVNPLNYM